MYHLAQIQKYKRLDSGALFQIFIPEFDPQKKISSKCELRLDDGRYISNDQRRLLYALFRDIAYWSGHLLDEIKEILKVEFMIDCKKDYFSLSNTDMTTAREFIEYVLEFIFHHGIPLSEKVSALAKEVNNYLYLCIVHKQCAIHCPSCEGGVEIHHVDAVGLGRDRTKIDHTKHRLIALCTKHHHMAHTIGWLTFKEIYFVDGIKVDAETIKRIGL